MTASPRDARTPFDAAGAQAERTGLAWHRTGLALAGVAALLLHAAEGTPLLVRAATAAGLVAAAAALVASGLRRRAVLGAAREDDTDPGAPSTRLVRGTGVAAALLGAAALVVVLGA